MDRYIDNHSHTLGGSWHILFAFVSTVPAGAQSSIFSMRKAPDEPRSGAPTLIWFNWDQFAHQLDNVRVNNMGEYWRVNTGDDFLPFPSNMSFPPKEKPMVLEGICTSLGPLISLSTRCKWWWPGQIRPFGEDFVFFRRSLFGSGCFFVPSRIWRVFSEWVFRAFLLSKTQHVHLWSIHVYIYISS